MTNPLDEKSDEALMADLVAGDRAAYAALVNRHANRFLSVAMRLMGNQSAAEDMLQEAFIKLFTHGEKFDASQGKFTTWFYRVVSNRCLDELRRKKPESLVDDYDAADESETADERIEGQETVKTILDALKALPDRQQLAITLCYYEGLSNKEAADVMEINIKALESLLTRGRAKLKKMLNREKENLL